MWNDIRDTVLTELSDLQDTAGVTRVMVRLLFAGVLGGLLGYQREHHGKSAGLRTHVLVALGSAVYALTPQQAGASPESMTRVVQGIVVGIGFLGAGAIVKEKKSDQVNGLTTAAGIWTTAAIGMTAGYGREMTATICTLLALAVLAFVPHTKSLRGEAIARPAHPMPPPQPADETKML